MTSRLSDPTNILDHRCLRGEPDLADLLADEIMDSVLRSAQVDREQLRQQLSELASRVRDSG